MSNEPLFVFLAGTINKGQELITRNIIAGISRCLNVIVIDTFGSNKLEKLLVGENVRFIKYKGAGLKNWNEIEKYNKKFIVENKIKRFIFIKHFLVTGVRNGEETTLIRFFKSYKENPRSGFSYVSLKKVLCCSLLIKNVIESGATVMSFSIDPLEPNYNNMIPGNKVKNLFISVRDGYTYMPCYEYVMNEAAQAEDMRKTNEFVFYCTCFSERREHMLKYRNMYDGVPGYDVKIIGRNDRNKDCKKQESYYSLISSSKYTLCIPAYDETSFSIIRFLEAVCRNCLCLVLKSCNLDEVLFTFPDIYDIINKRGLIVDNLGDIPKKIQELGPAREVILWEIKNSRSFRKIMNPDLVKARWEKLLQKLESR